MANNYIGKIKLSSGGDEYLIGSTAYGVCNTAAGTAAKTVSMPGFALITGATIHVKFSYANTAANPTLNVNSTGAKPIVNHGITAPTTDNGWWDEAVVQLTYDGTSWVRDYAVARIPSITGYFVAYNVTVSFSSDNTYSDYPYRGTYSNGGITSGMYAEVVFSLANANSGNYAPICETGNGVLYVYSKVNTSITIPTIVLFYEDGDFNAVLTKNFIYISSSAPSDTTLMWIDSAHNNIAKVYDGSNWITVAGAFA